MYSNYVPFICCTEKTVLYRLSRDSEVTASEFLENLEEMFLLGTEVWMMSLPIFWKSLSLTLSFVVLS